MFWDVASGLLNLGAGLWSDSQNQRMNREAMEMSQRQFDAQMDQSVQRRVADARKAGIHPLFALGGSVGASPTMSAGGRVPVGQAAAAARALGAFKPMARAQKRSLDASAALDEARANEINSRLAREAQAGASQIPELTTETIPNWQTIDKSYARQMEQGTKGMPNLWIRVWDNQRDMPVWTIDPRLGLDEVGQAAFIADYAKSSVIDSATDIGKAIIDWYGKLDRESERIVREKFPELYRKINEAKKKIPFRRN